MEKLIEQIDKLKKGIDSKGTPEAFKTKMKSTLADLEKQLAEKKAEAAAKEDIKSEKKETPSEPKKEEGKKRGRPAGAPKKESKKDEKPKASSKDEQPDCEELEKEWEARRKRAKKANKKYKSRSVSTKIGNDLAGVVSKAIKNTPAEDITKATIKKYETLETSLENFAKSLKSVLGDDFDKDELLKPIHDAVAKVISDIKKKTAK